MPSHITVTGKADGAVFKDKDVLLIGKLPANITTLDQNTAENLEKVVSSTVSGKGQAAGTEDPENAPLAAVVSVKSPADAGRTVVALMSAGARGAKLLNEGLSDRSKLQSAAGGTVFVTEQGVLGFKPTETWCSGNLPWYQRVWVSLANRPFLLVLFALIAAVAAGWGIFAGMRRYLRGRSSI